MSWRKGAHWAVFAGLVVLVGLTQAGALSREVIDWDESTFIVLAGRLLDGHLPYSDLFDNKPPMIFFYLAAAMAMFGESLITVRLFGDLCILVTVLLTVACLRRFVPDGPAWLAGVCLVAAFATWPAQHTSTELPAMVAVMGALWLVLAQRRHIWALLAVGVLVSLAVLTRSNLAVLAVAVGVWLVWAETFAPRAAVPRWGVVAYTLGGLAPLAVFGVLYGAVGALDDFVLSVVIVPMSYVDNQSGAGEVLLKMTGGWAQMISWAPLWHGGLAALMFAGGLVSLARAGRAGVEVGVVVCFGGAVLVSVLISGVGYMHYWLHLFPFAAMLGASVLAWLWFWPAGRVVAIIGVALITLDSLRHTVPDLTRWAGTAGALEQEWVLKNAADRIAPVLLPEDEVWAVQGHLILWYLGRPPVSRVAAHPDNINRPPILEPLVAAGYEAADPLMRVYQRMPAVIVVSDRSVPDYLKNGPRDFSGYLQAGYGVYFEQPGAVVYLRLDHPGWAR